MFRKLVQVMLWFFTVPVILLTSYFLIHQQKINEKSVNLTQNLTIPSTVKLQTNNVEGQVLAIKIIDMRPYFVEKFLKNTPLESYAKSMVESADQYGLDYRLIPAIAMKETQGGITAREGSFNAWGFDNGRTNFTSWETAINSVTKTLKEKYVDKGLVTPEQIMTVYAPPQLLTGGKWAKDINFFFSKLDSL